jgi:hypothetical protein
VAVPVAWVLAETAPESLWLFLSAAISLAPLAGVIGRGTEQLARRSGPALGGFLDATFGNAAELHYPGRGPQQRAHRAAVTGGLSHPGDRIFLVPAQP